MENHFANVDGVLIEVEWDEGGLYFVNKAPDCPRCNESLGAFCDSDSRKVVLFSAWHDTHYVECDNCSTRFPIDDAPMIKERSQADGWEGIVEDSRGDDRS